MGYISIAIPVHFSLCNKSVTGVMKDFARFFQGGSQLCRAVFFYSFNLKEYIFLRSSEVPGCFDSSQRP